MTFGAPAYLALLGLAVLAALAVAAGAWWRARARSRFGAGPHRRASAYLLPPLLIAALALGAFAAARPQFGTRQSATEERGIDLVVVLDVSQSMLADDAQPSRLAHAQAEVGALLDRMYGDHVGLIIFAGRPFLRSPLTADLRALRAIVEGVDHERGLVEPGSDLGAAMASAEQLLAGGDAQTKAIVIASDGEDHGGNIAPALAAARAGGIIVYTAGVGTATGAPVRDIDPASGTVTVRQDAFGRPVMTRLDASTLARIATAGNGRYIELAGDGRPLAALAVELRRLATTAFGSRQTATRIERFQIFAAIALALVLAELLLPAVRRMRPAVAWRATKRAWPLAAAGLFVGALCSADVAEINRRGNEAYQQERFNEAAAQYSTAEAMDPARPELYPNAGNALDRAGDLDRAIDQSQRGLDAARDTYVEPLAEYGLGNHLAAAGKLDEAREAYKRALLADPNDEDAKHNLEIIDARLRATPTARPAEPSSSPQVNPNSGSQNGTPGAGNGTPSAAPGQGTPDPASDQPPSPEELQRQLNEALAGIDKEFTEEDAARILDLLDRANRQTTEQRPGTRAAAGAQDY